MHNNMELKVSQARDGSWTAEVYLAGNTEFKVWTEYNISSFGSAVSRGTTAYIREQEAREGRQESQPNPEQQLIDMAGPCIDVAYFKGDHVEFGMVADDGVAGLRIRCYVYERWGRHWKQVPDLTTYPIDRPALKNAWEMLKNYHEIQLEGR